MKLKTIMFENKIIFHAEKDFYFNHSIKPEPAIKNMPDWWKEIPKYVSIQQKNNKKNIDTVSVKSCAPTFDAMSAGYIIKLWKNIYVEKDNSGQQIISWDKYDYEDNFFTKIVTPWNNEQVSNFEIPDGYSKTVLKLKHGWLIITPKGWSSLFVHPIGYNNLPFMSIPGLVDTDILRSDINCPFVIKSNFEGVIPKGTPMVQVIPIKRSSWKSEYRNGSLKEFEEQSARIELQTEYYSSIRSRKEYKLTYI